VSEPSGEGGDDDDDDNANPEFTIAVGASSPTGLGVFATTGAVHVYTCGLKANTACVLRHSFSPLPNVEPSTEALLGRAVAVSKNGKTLVVVGFAGGETTPPSTTSSDFAPYFGTVRAGVLCAALGC
jgi:hypothetical protein